MADYQLQSSKFHKEVTFTEAGVIEPIGGTKLYGEQSLTVTVEGVGNTNVVEIQGKLIGASSWTLLDTVTGADTSYKVDISTFDLIRFNVSTYEASGTPKLIASGYFSQSSFSYLHNMIDPAIQHATRIIYANFGERVSVLEKSKDLLKYGRNANIGTSEATVMTLPTGILHETYVNRNLITHISSASSSDTGIITVEGHTLGSDISISGITQTAGIATATSSSTHGFAVDEWVYIEGANESGYNGIVQVDTVPTTTTFTYSVDSGTSSPATGTITATSQNKIFSIQTITLAGQTKTELTTPLGRVTRLYVGSQNRATNLVGPVYVYEDDTVTSGVPDTDTKVHAITPAGVNQTEKASTTISKNDYWIITGFQGHVLEKSSSFVDMKLQIRRVGGLFRKVEDISPTTGSSDSVKFFPYIIVPSNADVRLVATAGSTGRDVSGSIQGYLAIVK